MMLISNEDALRRENLALREENAMQVAYIAQLKSTIEAFNREAVHRQHEDRALLEHLLRSMACFENRVGKAVADLAKRISQLASFKPKMLTSKILALRYKKDIAERTAI
jgi:hypothetical protein